MAYCKLFVVIVAVIFGYSFYIPFDPESLKGKKVIVTGASTGIGEQLAYFYSNHGSEVVIVARNIERMKKVVRTCKENGALAANYVKADLSAGDDAYFGEVINKSVALLGGKLDTLVLNHVIDQGAYSKGGYYKNYDMERLQWLFRVNFFSYVSMAQQSIDYLEESAGNIVVVGSAAGKMGLPNFGEYSSSKHALFGYFESLRLDFRKHGSKIGITSSMIGSINTENARENTKESNIPDSAWASPRDCAAAIAIGGEARVKEVYYPFMMTYPVFILRAFPTLLTFIIETLKFY